VDQTGHAYVDHKGGDSILERSFAGQDTTGNFIWEKYYADHLLIDVNRSILAVQLILHQKSTSLHKNIGFQGRIFCFWIQKPL